VINIKRDGKHTIHLSFDLGGAEQLRDAFQLALEGNRGEIKLEEITIINNKNVKTLVILRNNFQDKLSLNDSNLYLELDDEAIIYNLDRLKNCVTESVFYPGEMCEVNFLKGSITVYGILKI
jgi:hypothetical protein